MYGIFIYVHVQWISGIHPYRNFIIYEIWQNYIANRRRHDWRNNNFQGVRDLNVLGHWLSDWAFFLFSFVWCSNIKVSSRRWHVSFFSINIFIYIYILIYIIQAFFLRYDVRFNIFLLAMMWVSLIFVAKFHGSKKPIGSMYGSYI